MKKVSKTLALGGIKYYQAHLRIASSVMPVTPTNRELDILAAFLQHVSEGAVITREARKAAIEDLGISESNLANFVKRMATRKLIVPFLDGDQKKYRVHPVLVPDPESQEYSFKIVNDAAV